MVNFLVVTYTLFMYTVHMFELLQALGYVVLVYAIVVLLLVLWNSETPRD